MKNAHRHFPESTILRYVNATGSAQTAGTPVRIGNMWAVLQNDALANSGNEVAAHTQGQFRFAKATGGGTALAQGQLVSWDSGNARVAAYDPLLGPAIGRASAAVVDADAEVVVSLNTAPMPRSGSVAIAVDSTAAALNSGNGRVTVVTGLGSALRVFHVTVYNATTGVTKVGHAVTTATPGTIQIDGIAAGVQLDAGDTVHVTFSE